MLPYTMPQSPYASGNYLTEQSIRGYNYPFSVANPNASPWGTQGVDGYYPSTASAPTEPHKRGRLAGLFDWISELNMVDGTLILTGIGLTILFVCGMVTETIQSGIKSWERNEKREAKAERPNRFQRMFGRK